MNSLHIHLWEDITLWTISWALVDIIFGSGAIWTGVNYLLQSINLSLDDNITAGEWNQGAQKTQGWKKTYERLLSRLLCPVTISFPFL